MKKQKTTRISQNFSDDLDEIRQERLKLGTDKKKLSDRRITELITKNKYWRDVIKKEIIDLDQFEINKLLENE